VILYRIFSGFNDDGNSVVDNDFLPALTINPSKIDSFSIVADYRDPFLGNMKFQTLAKPIEKKEEIPPKTIPFHEVLKKDKDIWPAIVYGGVIKNQSSNKEIALIKINNGEKLMVVGDIAEEVELLSVYKDSIGVIYGGEQKYVKK